MDVIELWSQDDRNALERFTQAIEDASLLHALLAIEGADLAAEGAAVLRHVERWSELVERMIPSEASPRQQAEFLAVVLGEGLGFKGDDDDYYSSRNSLISQVVERRRGLPILLSAVWQIVGRRAGIQVDGVGMPGHFIARVGGDDGILVDPFAGGDTISHERCVAIVQTVTQDSIEWSEDFLERVPLDVLLERVLNNLLNSYRLERSPFSIYRTTRFLLTLRPENPGLHLLHGSLSEQFGAFDLAEESYTTIIAQHPQSEERGVAERLLGRLAQRRLMTH